MMDGGELARIARAMVVKNKGILAADESTGTITKRFAGIKLESTEEHRRSYREMLFTAPGAATWISGVILYEETLRQKTRDGVPFPVYLEKNGIIPGIKVDTGAKPLAQFAGETITEGLDGLRERLIEYRGLGARFAKWRAVIDIGPGIPTFSSITTNAHALARYAALCQEQGIVPIVEPEVLMDGDHDIDTCARVTEWTLKEVFTALFHQRVVLEGMVLKPNMVISGMKCPKQASLDEVAARTVEVLKRCVPAAVPGIAFLSGGQSDIDATTHLNAMNAKFDLPWPLTFSYGRALQAAPQKAWSGKAENVSAAQRAFTHRAQMNGLAATGTWKPDLEKAA